VKNEVGALATSIIYELEAFSIAELGIKNGELGGTMQRSLKILHG